MFALILHLEAIPMHIGSSAPAAWTLFAGMTIRPDATSSRIVSTGRSSRLAQNSISGVISPARAAKICVSLILLPAEFSLSPEGAWSVDTENGVDELFCPFLKSESIVPEAEVTAADFGKLSLVIRREHGVE